MALTLNDDEVLALRQALDTYLPELQYELARIKRERDRHPLVELDRTLTALREKLAAGPAVRSAG